MDNVYRFGRFILGRSIAPFILILILILTTSAHAELWEDATENTIGEIRGWSNKVELADVNGDGKVDILFANGGNYKSPGKPQFNNVFLNDGPGKKFIDATKMILGPAPDLARVI